MKLQRQQRKRKLATTTEQKEEESTKKQKQIADIDRRLDKILVSASEGKRYLPVEGDVALVTRDGHSLPSPSPVLVDKSKDNRPADLFLATSTHEFNVHTSIVSPKSDALQLIILGQDAMKSFTRVHVPYEPLMFYHFIQGCYGDGWFPFHATKSTKSTGGGVEVEAKEQNPWTIPFAETEQQEEWSLFDKAVAAATSLQAQAWLLDLQEKFLAGSNWFFPQESLSIKLRRLKHTMCFVNTNKWAGRKGQLQCFFTFQAFAEMFQDPKQRIAPNDRAYWDEQVVPYLSTRFYSELGLHYRGRPQPVELIRSCAQAEYVQYKVKDDVETKRIERRSVSSRDVFLKTKNGFILETSGSRPTSTSSSTSTLFPADTTSQLQTSECYVFFSPTFLIHPVDYREEHASRKSFYPYPSGAPSGHPSVEPQQSQIDHLYEEAKVLIEKDSKDGMSGEDGGENSTESVDKPVDQDVEVKQMRAKDVEDLDDVDIKDDIKDDGAPTHEDNDNHNDSDIDVSDRIPLASFISLTNGVKEKLAIRSPGQWTS